MIFTDVLTMNESCIGRNKWKKVAFFLTKGIWQASDICDLDRADQLDWRCVGCDVSVFPVAWNGLRKYKKQPTLNFIREPGTYSPVASSRLKPFWRQAEVGKSSLRMVFRVDFLQSCYSIL
jgi:hypothetical protein